MRSKRALEPALLKCFADLSAAGPVFVVQPSCGFADIPIRALIRQGVGDVGRAYIEKWMIEKTGGLQYAARAYFRLKVFFQIIRIVRRTLRHLETHGPPPMAPSPSPASTGDLSATGIRDASRCSTAHATNCGMPSKSTLYVGSMSRLSSARASWSAYRAAVSRRSAFVRV